MTMSSTTRRGISYRILVDEDNREDTWDIKVERSAHRSNQWEEIYSQTVTGMISDALEALCQAMWDEEEQIWD